MTYVFFDFRKNKLEVFKTKSLENLKRFVSSLGLKNNWIKFEQEDEILFSDDEKLSVEVAKGDEESLKGVQVIYPMN